MNEAEQNTQRIMTELLAAHAQTKRMQDDLTAAINANTEMQRIIRDLRVERERHISGMYLQTYQLANAQMDKIIKQLREALMKIATSTQQAYDYDRIGSGEFDDKYPEYQELDPEKMFMNAAIQANETARAALEVK